MRTASKRLGFKVTPHMLRHTFATQLVNGGAKVTTIQALLGHQRLNTTMTYARVHDKTVVEDYFRAMEAIEGEQMAAMGQEATNEEVHTLLGKLEQQGLSAKQQQILNELRRCLTK